MQNEHKVMIVFTKDAIENDKEQQLLLYEDLGWDIYEINDNKRIDYVKAFAEEAKKAGASKFCVLNEVEDIDFTNLIFETCNGIIDTEVRDTAFSRFSEVQAQQMNKALQQSNVAAAQNTANQQAQNAMNQIKNSQPIIYIGLLLNIQIASKFSLIKKCLFNPALNFMNSFNDQVKAKFKNALLADIKSNPALVTYSNIINNPKVIIKPKLIFVDGDKKMENLCQPYLAREFLDLVWKHFDESSINLLQKSDAFFSIDMQNPNNFFIDLKAQSKNPSFFVLYNMNKNENEYQPFDGKSPIFIVNDPLLSINRQANMPSTLGLYNTLLKQTAFDATAFTTPIIKKQNIELRTMAAKITEDLVRKGYKPAHKVISNSEIDINTKIQPASVFIYGLAKFNKNLTFSDTELQKRKDQQEDQLKLGVGAMIKAIGTVYKSKASVRAGDEMIQAAKGLNQSYMNDLQKYGIDEKHTNTIKLHKDFPKAAEVLFSTDELKIEYDKNKN